MSPFQTECAYDGRPCQSSATEGDRPCQDCSRGEGSADPAVPEEYYSVVVVHYDGHWHVRGCGDLLYSDPTPCGVKAWLLERGFLESLIDGVLAELQAEGPGEEPEMMVVNCDHVQANLDLYVHWQLEHGSDGLLETFPPEWTHLTVCSVCGVEFEYLVRELGAEAGADVQQDDNG